MWWYSQFIFRNKKDNLRHTSWRIWFYSLRRKATTFFFYYYCFVLNLHFLISCYVFNLHFFGMKLLFWLYLKFCVTVSVPVVQRDTGHYLDLWDHVVLLCYPCTILSEDDCSIALVTVAPCQTVCITCHYSNGILRL